MLTNEYMVDKFDYAKELQPYKGMGLCSECGRLATSPDGRDVVVPGKWHGKFPKEKAWDMKIKLDVFEAIKNYAPDDILIISNQGGIEKGFVDREMFEYKFDYISNALEDYTDVSVSAYYCESNNKRNANRKPNIGMIKEYMDFIEYMNNDEDEEEKIVYDTILMIGDASGKEGQFSDSDKKTAENFGCEYMDVDDFVDKYKD
jgi:histidinol phosphatase-like enzyme